MMRVNKVKGEGDPKSFFEQVHKVRIFAQNVVQTGISWCCHSCFAGFLPQVQLLTGEYVPLFVALILYIDVQSKSAGVPVSAFTDIVIAGTTIGRYLFAGRLFIPIFSYIGATLTYISFFGLIIVVGSYSV